MHSRNIRTIPRDTLADLAIAMADPYDPVIYYNPRLMERYGPEISAFVLAHEEAHIRLAHRRPGGGLRGEFLEELLQGWELDADCAAAIELSRTRPAALLAAISLFRRLGAWRMDLEHPTGTIRATRLVACGETANGDPRRIGEGPRVNSAPKSFR